MFDKIYSIINIKAICLCDFETEALGALVTTHWSPVLVGDHVFRVDGNFIISYPRGQEVTPRAPILPSSLDLSLQALVDLLLAHVPELPSECPLLVGQLLWWVGAKALLRSLRAAARRLGGQVA